MAARALKIAVIGGGIGGLSAALCLLRQGFDVHVYEQVAALREIGAGIVLTPNATRVLYGLGFRPTLERLGVAIDAWRQRRWQDGRTLLLGEVGEMKGPSGERLFFTSHRADILAMLRDALPPERLHLRHRLEGFSDGGNRVTLRFADGSQAEADIVIGADGIHSTVREILLGKEDPQFTACIAYRGLVSAERLTSLNLPNESQLWLGPGRHFVHYPVSGGRLINFVCLIDQDEWAKESWTEPGKPADALGAYDGWHDQVRAILGAVEETFIWGLFDRAPLPRWSSGRVTLLGDACHPMLPFLAQGAAQAIEDAATLAEVLSQSDDVTGALRYYEELRKPRTAAIQAVARGNKTRNHLPDGPEQIARDSAMATGEAQWSIGASAWVYDHDAVDAARTGALGLPNPSP
jgi:2-polyprenyl-6-methoxyphenol hydroxylase-like FAD-dependent oxidoreductase